MSDDRIDLCALVEKARDADLPREIVGFAGERHGHRGAVIEPPGDDTVLRRCQLSGGPNATDAMLSVALR